MKTDGGAELIRNKTVSLHYQFISILQAPTSTFFLFLFNISLDVGTLPACSDGKESACDAGHVGSIPGLGRSPGEGNGNPLQFSCLENPMKTDVIKQPIKINLNRNREKVTFTKALTTIFGQNTSLYLIFPFL